MERARYNDLRSLVPELSATPDLRPLVGWEAAQLLRFEAPVEILGKAPAPMRVRRHLILGVTGARNNDVSVRWLDGAVRWLEELLETWAGSYAPVALKPLRMGRPVPFDLAQGARTIEWKPLSVGFRVQLLLAPGYVIDEMPDLPASSHTHTLLVTTQPREGTGVVTEISVDNDLLLGPALGLGVDLAELALSLKGEGEYWIITDPDGEVIGTGIHRGVDVYSDGGKVYWVIYEPGPARTLVFDEQAYHRAVEIGLADFRGMCQRHPPPPHERWQLNRVEAID